MEDRVMRALVLETDSPGLAKKISSEFGSLDIAYELKEETSQESNITFIKLYVSLLDEQRAFETIDKLLLK